MKNLYNYPSLNRIISLAIGMLGPFLLVSTIALSYDTKVKPEHEKPPIILKMTALNMQPLNQKKSAEKLTPKLPKKITVKNKQLPKPIKNTPLKKPLLDEKTIIAKKTVATQPQEQPQQSPSKMEKILQKKIEKPIIAKQNEIINDLKPEPRFPTPTPIFKLTEVPRFLHKEQLVYPELMRSSGMTGVVKLAVLIGKEGVVYRVKILKSAGDAFDQAARKALLASTFIPAKVGKQKVAVELHLPVKFRLL